MARCETVEINRDGVKVIINKSDLKDSDKLWSEPVKQAAKKPVKKAK